MSQQNPVVGDTRLFRLTASLDGDPWDLADASAVLTLYPPSGSPLVRAGTVTDAALGVAEYQGTTADLSAAGTWFLRWTVTDDAVSPALVLSTAKIPFTVSP